MSDHPPSIVNAHTAPETTQLIGEHWGAHFTALTPEMKLRGGRLGINRFRVPKGRSVCPFHFHQREDEAFFVISGRGVLRYGEHLREIGPGDCISCPAGTGIAHQILNPHDEDLVYLAIGHSDPDEVCVYPDNGKVLVRSLKRIGVLQDRDYLDGEPSPPRIHALARTPISRP
jgi:uncharacterized cupin superfamily protein